MTSAYRVSHIEPSEVGQTRLLDELGQQPP